MAPLPVNIEVEPLQIFVFPEMDNAGVEFTVIVEFTVPVQDAIAPVIV